MIKNVKRVKGQNPLVSLLIVKEILGKSKESFALPVCTSLKQNSKAIEKSSPIEMHNNLSEDYSERTCKESYHKGRIANDTCKLRGPLSLSFEQYDKGKTLRTRKGRNEEIPSIFSNIKINSLNRNCISKTLTILNDYQDNIKPIRRGIYSKYANKVLTDS